MAFHNILGKEGEQMATEFLISKGITIRETNWRLNNLEVDIIGEKDGVLHFVEVKTRSTGAFDPMLAITAAKKRNLVNAANGYVRYCDLMNHGVQFDVITFVGRGDDKKLEYIPEAFYPKVKTYR